MNLASCAFLFESAWPTTLGPVLTCFFKIPWFYGILPGDDSDGQRKASDRVPPLVLYPSGSEGIHIGHEKTSFESLPWPLLSEFYVIYPRPGIFSCEGQYVNVVSYGSEASTRTAGIKEGGRKCRNQSYCVCFYQFWTWLLSSYNTLILTPILQRIPCLYHILRNTINVNTANTLIVTNRTTGFACSNSN